MKKDILKVLIVFLFYANCYSQRITIKSIESRLITNEGVEFVGELKDKANDYYSFSNWSNQGILYLNNTMYLLSNINFNVSTNTFDSRIDRMKLFAFKSSTLDSVKIDGHLFKKVDNYYYEVLVEKNDKFLLKQYDIKFTDGAINHLDLSIGRSSTSIEYKYLIKFEDKFTQIEFKKNNILSLVKDDFQDVLEEFIDKEKLSYRREDDIVKILEFIFKNSNKMI